MFTGVTTYSNSTAFLKGGDYRDKNFFEKEEIDYYPFGMLMPNRYGSDVTPADDYKYGFNGMEMDDEVNGTKGSSYTAEFWQYDSRLGRRWNIDPVIKSWEASYTSLSNNPLIMVDPKGDDDYYNMKGEYLYTDTRTSTDIRLITQEQWENTVNTYTAEILDKNTSSIKLLSHLDGISKVVTMDADEAKKLKKMWDDSNPNGNGSTKKEHGAQLILDVKNAKLYVNVLDATNNTRGGTHFPIPQTEGGVSYVKGDKTKIILGIVHTHPNKKSEGYDQNINQTDSDMAKKRKYQSYILSHAGVDKISSDRKSNKVVETENYVPMNDVFTKKESLLLDALETSGGKPL